MNLDVPRLGTVVETTGYFIVAEAINNAVKHARATRLSHREIDEGRDELVLTVEDDGIGGADPPGDRD